MRQIAILKHTVSSLCIDLSDLVGRVEVLEKATCKTYTIKVGCRNCGSAQEIEIAKGRPAQTGVQGAICENCGLPIVPQQPKPQPSAGATKPDKQDG